MCVTDPWAHMSFVHSILFLKLGVTGVELLVGVHAKASDYGFKSHQMTCDARLSDLVGHHRIKKEFSR